MSKGCVTLSPHGVEFAREQMGECRDRDAPEEIDEEMQTGGNCGETDEGQRCRCW